jgi:hypothetical protein
MVIIETGDDQELKQCKFFQLALHRGRKIAKHRDELSGICSPNFCPASIVWHFRVPDAVFLFYRLVGMALNSQWWCNEGVIFQRAQ